ncbi:hypothetical protein HYC85_010053 [Camellia sinensis]|uniref:Uncharacterized protein n=1 Tax=Camellia sinensis TaxID=4442 RepID=A0A7J7HHC7_CAMSI|nr:hypothetical protein HYC85_010053 [Camellia sinensis]
MLKITIIHLQIPHKNACSSYQHNSFSHQNMGGCMTQNPKIPPYNKTINITQLAKPTNFSQKKKKKADLEGYVQFKLKYYNKLVL